MAKVRIAPGRRIFAVFAVSAALLAATGMAEERDGAEADERDMSAVQCLRIIDIDRIDIVDAQTLIFRMRGQDLYLNRLPHRCPGLDRRSPLLYRTSVGRLCNVDVITVLENWGFGYAPGASCGLGMFHPITPEDADALLGRDAAEGGESR